MTIGGSVVVDAGGIRKHDKGGNRASYLDIGWQTFVRQAVPRPESTPSAHVNKVVKHNCFTHLQGGIKVGPRGSKMENGTI